MENYISVDNILLDSTFSTTYNYNYMLNDIIKISDTKVCYASTNSNKDELNIVILTLSAVFMVQTYYDKLIELANMADLIVANKAELEEFCGKKTKDNKELFTTMSKKLDKKERLFVVTDGKKGAIVAKYDYDRGSMDFILRGFPSNVKSEDIVD